MTRAPAHLHGLLPRTLILACLLGFMPRTDHAAPHPTPAASALSSDHLPHLLQLTPTLLCGGAPMGDAAFRELAALGVTTLISVDGAKPDVDRARHHGLRYVHLPIGYDGIPRTRQAELARAASMATGIVYVHCHHGRHRGPAAAAIIGAWTGGWPPSRTAALLEQAGTGPQYPGLYHDVAQARPDARALAQVGDLPEVASVPTTVEAMVLLDTQLVRLKASAARSFRPARGQTEPPAAQAATLLREGLAELMRLEEPGAPRPPDYRRRLEEARSVAVRLERSLQSEPSPSGATALLEDLARSCSACHRAHRDDGEGDPGPLVPP